MKKLLNFKAILLIIQLFLLGPCQYAFAIDSYQDLWDQDESEEFCEDFESVKSLMESGDDGEDGDEDVDEDGDEHLPKTSDLCDDEGDDDDDDNNGATQLHRNNKFKKKLRGVESELNKWIQIVNIPVVPREIDGGGDGDGEAPQAIVNERAIRILNKMIGQIQKFLSNCGCAGIAVLGEQAHSVVGDLTIASETSTSAKIANNESTTAYSKQQPKQINGGGMAMALPFMWASGLTGAGMSNGGGLFNIMNMAFTFSFLAF